MQIFPNVEALVIVCTCKNAGVFALVLWHCFPKKTADLLPYVCHSIIEKVKHFEQDDFF